jgi:two-component system, chemotaxis family, chemotaxis protein CheY
MATILVVDDYSTSQRLLGFILRQSDHTVVTAVHGLGALEKLAEKSIDLVITDLSMPEMDGMTLLQELRANPQFQSLPVIILTGSAYAHDNMRAKAAGATLFLTKPVESEELIAAVNRLLAPSESAEVLPHESAEAAAPNKVLDAGLLIGKPYLATRT